MFPPQFDYRKPGDLDTALVALDDDGAVALAGGHDLIPKLKQRDVSPGTVVDLGALDGLRGVDRERSAGAGESSGRLTIGALTTYADLLDESPTGVDGLLDATAAVGDPQIRNRGTVGGNLAAAHPASDLPAAALVADAQLHLVGLDSDRTLTVEEFYVADGETACRDDELLTEISLQTKPNRGCAYARKTHPSSGYAAIGVAASVNLDGGIVEEANVAVNGLTPRPIRLQGVEEALVGVEASAAEETAVGQAASHAGDGIDVDRVRADHLVSAEQRRRLLPSYTEQAVSKAITRAAERAGVTA